MSAAELALTDAERGAQGLDTARNATRARLSEIMLGIPNRHRVAVLGLVGVGNWHHNPEWSTIDLRAGAEVFVAFDADAATNLNVWNQARRMFALIENKGGEPLLLRPSLEGDPKAGVDDWLAANDLDLAGLLATAVPELPPPPKPAARPGDYRMDWELGTSSKAVVDEETSRVSWVDAEPYAGRLAALRQFVTATHEDVATGTVPKLNGEHKAGMVVETAWAESDGAVRTGTIEGPLHLLDAYPRDLSKLADIIPARLASHPEWPPSSDWMKAIKAERRGELGERLAYTHGGYAPVVHSRIRDMVYISGGDVIDSHGSTDVVEGGAATLYPAQSREFGLHPHEGGVNVEQLRADLLEFLPPYLGAWKNKGHAAAVLGAAFRPGVPLPSNSTLLLTGPKKSGKSWTARCPLQFHRASTGVWNKDKLTGSASSTAYAIEQPLATFTIWVADDVAPSASRSKSERTQATIGDMIRAVHNNMARDRGKAGPGMQTQYLPKAVFLVTAENCTTVGSELNRTVHLEYSGVGDLVDVHKDAVDVLVKTSLAPARSFTAGVQHVLGMVNRTGSWRNVVGWWDAVRTQLLESTKASTGAGGSDTRPLEKAVDLLLGLELLNALVQRANLWDEFGAELVGLRGALVALVMKQADEARSATPGRALLDALRTDLAAGRCHVAAPGTGNAPNVPGWDLALLAQLMGWRLPGGRPVTEMPGARPEDWMESFGTLRGEGPVVGRMVREPTGDRRWCVLLDPGAAQSVLIRDGGPLPYGVGVRDSLKAARGEGLVSGAWDFRGQLQRVMVKGQTLTGVAIPLEVLFPVDEPEEPDEQARAARRAELLAELETLSD